MIGNAVDYYQEWRERAGKPSSPGGDPLIDVVVRVGSRPIATVGRALRSIDGQTTGRYRVIFARFRPIDLSELTGASWHRIERFEIVDCISGGRAATLTAGLKA